ncbi:MAG: PKD domain-containing protein [Candidatus Thermoplasmatota archaeon]
MKMKIKKSISLICILALLIYMPIISLTIKADPPTNKSPVFSKISPPHNATNVPITWNPLSIHITDPENNSFSWTIKTQPNIGFATGLNQYNGTKKCLITNLQYNTTYTWCVNATDGTTWTNQTFCFTTQKNELLSPFLSYFGPYIDAADMNTTNWNRFLQTASDLGAIGFTHIGFHIWTQNPSDFQLTTLLNRIHDMRNLGYPLAFHLSSSHLILNNQLDPETHESNGQSIKFFDAPGFVVPDPSNSCYRHAHDPAYNGTLWQAELQLLDNYTSWIDIQNNDSVLFDTELWGKHPSWFNKDTGCFPHILEQSNKRYASHSTDDCYNEYIAYWRDRGLDLRSSVKNKNPETQVVFYGENIPPLRNSTWMPVGTGDISSPSWYFAPHLTTIQSYLDTYDFSNSYIWLSFSIVQSNLVYNPPGQNYGSYTSTSWDPKISQRIGYLLNLEGVKGIIIYPGPTSSSYTTDYFMQHATALAQGFIHGIDVDALSEICGDGWDNDGDGYWDESCGDTEDADGDGLLDSWEVDYFNSLEYSKFDDPDHDQLDNIHELYTGTNPNNPDSDSDTYTDGYEYEEATDPLDENDYPMHNVVFPPQISFPNPNQNAVNVPLSTNVLIVSIHDPQGFDLFWSVSTSPNSGSSHGEYAVNGTKTCPISGLSQQTVYTWTVYAHNTYRINRVQFVFTTIGPSQPSGGQFFEPPYLPTAPPGIKTNSSNNPPRITKSPQGSTTARIDIPYTFSIVSYDSEGDQVRYRYECSDGTRSPWSSYTHPNISYTFVHSWKSYGTFSIRVQAQDIRGANSSWSDPLSILVFQIDPNTSSPTKEISIKHLQKDNTTFSFFINASNESMLLYSYIWDFGDGTIAEGINVVHRYGRDGYYTVVLTIRDGDGNEETIRYTVFVESPGLDEAVNSWLMVFSIVGIGGCIAIISIVAFFVHRKKQRSYKLTKII